MQSKGCYPDQLGRTQQALDAIENPSQTGSFAVAVINTQRRKHFAYLSIYSMPKHQQNSTKRTEKAQDRATIHLLQSRHLHRNR